MRQTIKADNRSKNKLDFIILGRGAYVAQKSLEKANWAKLTPQRRPDRVFGGHLRCDGQLIGCVWSTIYHVRDREEQVGEKRNVLLLSWRQYARA